MKRVIHFKLTLVIMVAIMTAGISCDTSAPVLKDAFADHFLIGAALFDGQLMGKDSSALELAEIHFNSLTAENVLKWERIHPRPGVYNFGSADKFVEFAEKQGVDIVGHCLLWHSQTPRWVFQNEEGNPTVRDTLLQRMHDHISTVVGRYKGRVNCWDLVNEPIGDDGQIRKTRWIEIIGDDFIQKAYEYAREADPDALFILNDYSLPDPGKSDCMVSLIKDLQSKGVTVDAVGLQAHYHLDYPTMEALEASIIALAETGVRIMITELDINVLPRDIFNVSADVRMTQEYRDEINPYIQGLPDSVSVALANQYRDLFSVFVKHSDKIDRVTFWGIHDGQSWLNNWPVRGRTNYPLLFDRNLQPRMAFESVIKTAGNEK